MYNYVRTDTQLEEVMVVAYGTAKKESFTDPHK